jgi:predicted nucleotidyltransferase component of viral defense system
MTLFDNLVDAALSHQPTLSNLRIVVEKELLHHDILRILSQHNLLKNLTFMGGTALRACYGGTRLSEDLDFTGGTDFTASSISHMSETLRYNLAEKYTNKTKSKTPTRSAH